jgi:hypothetical protein
MKDRYYIIRRYQEEFIPLNHSLFFLGWNKGRGNKPRESLLTEEDLKRTLQFNLSGDHRRFRLNYYAGCAMTADQYRSADHEMVKAFLTAMPRVLQERGLTGRQFVGGSVYRQKKKAWQAYLAQAIYQPDEWLLAKLIKSPDLEEDIWIAAGYAAIQY